MGKPFHREDGKAFFMGFRKNLKVLLYPAQNAKEFKTKRLYVLMQTPLRFISNALAFEIKRKGVLCLYFSLHFSCLSFARTDIS